MNYRDLSDPSCVRLALEEFDSLGRDAFLTKYGFGPAKKFYIRELGRFYDSKAILAAAYGFQFGTPLINSEFSGGTEAAVGHLQSLGFDVVDASPVFGVTSELIEQTLDKFDEIGRESFLAEYGGGGAAKFWLRARGRDYDAKPVLVMARRLTTGQESLSGNDVPSIEAHVATPLRTLGYQVIEKENKTMSHNISNLIQEVLVLQKQWVNDNKNSAMVKRLAKLEELQVKLAEALGAGFGWSGLQNWKLWSDVSRGVGGVPQVAWARLTDRSKSPSAMTGWYVVLLFSQDGSRCYVSLNQGTESVKGPGRSAIIEAKSVNARSLLNNSGSGGPDQGWLPYGGPPNLRVLGEPKLGGGARGRSYEIGHIDGVVYDAGAVPSDDVIVEHVEALLGMLGRLYDLEESMTVEKPLHVLLHWSMTQSFGNETIPANRNILSQRGSVIWVKFGRALANSKVAKLQAQIDSGVDTYLFLLGGNPRQLFRARIANVSNGIGDLDKSLIVESQKISITGEETCFNLTEIHGDDLYSGIDLLLALAGDPTKKVSESVMSQANVLYVNERSTQMPSAKINDVANRLNMSVFEVQKFLDGVSGSKRQMILMGPPGTGKTFVAQEIASLLVEESSQIKLVQFHPSYGYEDFIEGLRPMPSSNGGFEFKRFPGAVVDLTEQIGKDGKRRVFIIDEINRANIPKVFGELMFLLEYRDKTMKLMLDNREFSLPDNLIIIGTMNTADRSIRTLDIAMRRRFRFFELGPRSEVLVQQYGKSGWSNAVGEALYSGFEQLNEKLKSDIDRHHTIGHSYFLQRKMTADVLQDIWAQEVFPLIEDYFFDQPSKVAEYEFRNFWPDV